MLRKQAEWMLTLKTGDVISNGHANRVVRKITRFADGELKCVQLAIRKCSWTHRPTTTMNYTDILKQGYAPVGVTVKLTSPADRRILKEDPHGRAVMDCCEAKDLP
jgi:2-keto-4-pentenoate hydratase